MATRSTKRPPDDVQPSLFEESEAPKVEVSIDVRNQILEQIRRDCAVLEEDPMFWVPSREFYEERIAMFREEYRRLTI